MVEWKCYPVSTLTIPSAPTPPGGYGPTRTLTPIDQDQHPILGCRSNPHVCLFFSASTSLNGVQPVCLLPDFSQEEEPTEECRNIRVMGHLLSPKLIKKPHHRSQKLILRNVRPNIAFNYYFLWVHLAEIDSLCPEILIFLVIISSWNYSLMLL